MEVSQKLKRELPYDLATSLPGIYFKKQLILKDTCIPMFLEVLFTIAKLWMQPKHPSTDEWINKMWYTKHIHIHATHTRILLSHNTILPLAARWTDLKGNNAKSEKERQTLYMISITCEI